MKDLRVLVVEDEAIVAMDIEERLERLGYDPVGQASTGEQAIELAEALRPQIVLMDIRLKGDMDGIAAALELRRRNSAPVIFLTANAENATLERARLAEPFGFISKPFKDFDLKSAIEIAHYRSSTEEEFRRLSGLLDLLGQVNQAIIRHDSREMLLAEVCRLSVQRSALSVAWLGWLDPAADRIEVVAGFDRDAGAATVVDSSAYDGSFCQGSPSRAIREGRSFFSTDCGSPECLHAASKVASGSIIRSCGCFPLLFQGEVRGVLSLGAESGDFFKARETALLEEVASDISFALDRFEEEARRERAEQSLLASEAKYRTVVENAGEIICRADREGRVLFSNRRLAGRSAEEAVGSDFADFAEPEFRDLARTELERTFADRGKRCFEIRSRHGDGIALWYEISLSSPTSQEGIESIIILCRDITERKQAAAIEAARLRVLWSASSSSLGELCRATIDEAEAITGSSIGFFQLVEADQVTISLQVWSTNTHLHMCEADKSRIHYSVQESGVWADCVREGRAVIHNDYASLPHKKGLPNGHSPIVRELVVPIRRKGLIVALLGVGNKPSNYTAADVGKLTALCDAVWEAIKARQLEISLQTSEATLAEVQEMARMGRWEMDMATGRTEWSDKIYSLLEIGRDAGSPSLESFLDSVLPEDRHLVIQALLSSTTCGRAFAIDHRLRMKDGRIKWVSVIGRITLDNEGQRRRLLASVHDISEKKALEARLLRLSAAVEQSPVSIVITDPAGAIEYANPKCLETSGYSLDEILGQNPRILKSGETGPEGYRDLWKTIEAGGEWRGTFHNKRKSGERYLESAAISSIRDASGSITSYLAVKEDITERVRMELALGTSEEKYRNLVENSRDIMFTLDLEGNFAYVSPAWTRLLGHPTEWVVGKNIVQFIHPDDHERCLEFMRFTSESTTGQEGIEYRVLHSDGSWRWHQSKAHAVRDSSGAITGWEGIATDISAAKEASAALREVEAARYEKLALEQNITERRQMEEALKASNLRLEAAMARATELSVLAQAATLAKSRFLASMSHEIRSPLNAILGFTQLMQFYPEGMSAVQAKRMAIINRNGEHLLSLLDDILVFSKIETGNLSLARGAIDLHAFLLELADMFRYKAVAKGLSFAALGVEGLPGSIVCDGQKLRQILINLLGNAVKFTQSGTIVLRAGLRAAKGGAEHKSRLVLEVVDSGPGISAAEMPLLFEAFEQTSSGRLAGQGTGLGLSISRQLARLMGGDLRAESEPGRGSSFRLELPLEIADASTMRANPPKFQRIEEGQGPCTVLVVDDSMAARSVIVQMLQAMGLETIEAESGVEALSVFAEKRPRLVLMDNRMPGMEGSEAIRRIRGGPGGADAKIIMLTADASDEVRDQSLEAGADDFIAKPFRLPDLLEMIRLLTGLWFRDAESAVAKNTPTRRASDLTGEMRLVPAELKRRLSEAAQRGRHDDLLVLIRKLAETRPALGGSLGELARDFDYEALIKACE